MVIAICGYTGQGVETAGTILSQLLESHGMVFRTWRDFSTIIRGGLTSFEAYLDDDYSGEAPARSSRVDTAVVWDNAALDRYAHRVADISDVYGSAIVSGISEANQDACDKLGFNLWALGIVAAKIGIPLPDVQSAVDAYFRSSVDTAVLIRGYEKAAEHGELRRVLRAPDSQSGPVVTMSGNDALCLGAVQGGVRFYCGYPITPASEILEYMARTLPDLGGVAYQVEDEIAAVHMAVGASYSGTRTFVATSGPGMDLMTEGLGYVATIEVPLVVVDNQRGGPSTGMPTKTEQSDLLHLRYSGHGEFARIVLSPTSVLDAMTTMQEALNLADYYQCPVFLALDLDLALRRVGLRWDDVRRKLPEVPIDRGRTVLDSDGPSNYRRFESLDGKPPWRTIPGVKGGAYVASGDEHDERGWMEPDFREVRGTLHERRLWKTKKIDYLRPLTEIGDRTAPIALIGTGAMSELIYAAVHQHPAKFRGILIRQLFPLPALALEAALGDSKEAVVCEYNATGQIETLLNAALASRNVHAIRRYDGEHFTVEEFVAKLHDIN